MTKGHTVRIAWLSLVINLAYGLYTAVLGIPSKSPWFLALAAYYIILGVMRFAALLCSKGMQLETERFILHFTGGMFLFLSATLLGITLLSFQDQKGSVHHEITMITIALYSFVKLTTSVVNLTKIRGTSPPMLKILRNISLADASVSIFSLQRSMLVSFEGMTAGNIRLMNALTGTAVYLLVAVLGINLIGGKNMAKSKLVTANKKVAEAVTEGYKKIEKGVVDGYERIEKGVVAGYEKLEDKFVDQFLTRDGETLEEAKARLKGDRK